MKRVLALAAVAAVALTGCELGNGSRTAHGIANEIIDQSHKVCDPRGGTANIAFLEDRHDDVIFTCKDGSNHFFDG